MDHGSFEYTFHSRLCGFVVDMSGKESIGQHMAGNIDLSLL